MSKDDGKETKEMIYDVACADDREIVERRCASPVGNTVNLDTGAWDNSIGAASLSVQWTDPDFDPQQRALRNNYHRLDAVA